MIMKKVLKFILPAACILALSAACSEKIDPVELADGEEIRFAVDQADTKALIESGGLAVAGTQLRVFDILTGFSGTVNGHSPDATTGELTYIDNFIGYNGSAWPFVNADGTAYTPAYYRWTKTGTHTFFGYLTKDPAGNAFSGTVSMSGKVLSISQTELKPTTTPQFDFLYSDIIERNAATGPYTAIPLSMKHLFTALAVDIVNETGAAITNLSVTFTNMHPAQSATIDWGTPLSADSNNKVYPTVTYAPTLANQTLENAEAMEIGTLSSISFSEEQPVTAHLFLNGEYRLLWPQAILAPTENAAGSQVSVTYEGCTVARTANLVDLLDNDENPITTMEAGKKYLLTITIMPLEVRFNIIVTDLENMNAKEGNTETFYFES